MTKTLPHQILSGKLLLVVPGEQKSNFIGRFKLEPVATHRHNIALLINKR